MTNHQRTRVTLTVLLLIIQAGLMIGITVKGNQSFLRNIAGSACFWVIYTYLEIKYDIYMPLYVRSVTMLTSLGDNFFGYYLNLYITSTVFDKIQHVFGSYSIALFTFVLSAQWFQQPLRKSLQFLLVVSLGLSVGALYEIAEFAGDRLTNPVIPSQPDLWDTDLDLISDAFGAILAGIHATKTSFFGQREV